MLCKFLLINSALPSAPLSIWPIQAMKIELRLNINWAYLKNLKISLSTHYIELFWFQMRYNAVIQGIKVKTAHEFNTLSGCTYFQMNLHCEMTSGVIQASNKITGSVEVLFWTHNFEPVLLLLKDSLRFWMKYTCSVNSFVFHIMKGEVLMLECERLTAKHWVRGSFHWLHWRAWTHIFDGQWLPNGIAVNSLKHAPELVWLKEAASLQLQLHDCYLHL